MTTDEKQEAIDFMEAQRLALAMTDLLAGKKVRIVSQAIALVTAEFCRTCGGDPHTMLVHLANGSLYFLNQREAMKDEPPPSVQ